MEAAANVQSFDAELHEFVDLEDDELTGGTVQYEQVCRYVSNQTP